MNEIKAIKQKQLDLYYNGYYGKGRESAKDVLIPAEFDGTYKFADINYDDTSRTTWCPSDHLYRISNMVLCGGEEMLRTDKEKVEKLIGALKYWIRKDPKSDNWWHNQIGALGSLSNVALALGDYLDEKTAAGIEKLLRRGSFKTNLLLGESEVYDLLPTQRYSTADKWTGANLIWGAAISLKHALFAEDEKLLFATSKRISEEIKYSTEGIQPDGGFCQHGPRWYSGGYGRSFVYELSPMIFVLSGTSFEIPKEKTEIVLSHIVDGQRLMQRNGVFDFGASGREYVRCGALSASRLCAPINLLLNSEGVSRKDELSELYSAIHDGKDEIEDTRYYDSIALLAHKKNGIYFGIRGRRSGILGAEHCNKEGVLSYNMTYGTVSCIMKSGKEYFDITPVWDYSKIPGTTAREESDEELLAKEDWANKVNSPCTCRGKTQDGSGILTEYAEHDGISLLATYFTFDGTLVCLGADIKDSTPNGKKLYTTVDQRIATEAKIEKNLVECEGVTYKNLDDCTEFISVIRECEGNWQRNNLFLASTPAKNTLLTITIPANDGGSYAYLVTADKNPDVTVLRNDSVCQAILAGEHVMAVFHKDGAITYNGQTISGKENDFLFWQ